MAGEDAVEAAERDTDVERRRRVAEREVSAAGEGQQGGTLRARPTDDLRHFFCVGGFHHRRRDGAVHLAALAVAGRSGAALAAEEALQRFEIDGGGRHWLAIPSRVVGLRVPRRWRDKLRTSSKLELDMKEETAGDKPLPYPVGLA